MNVLTTYLINTLAFNVAISIIIFAAVWASGRKGRELTFLRGTAVLLIGWVIGSVLVLVVHFLLSIGGTEIRDGPLEFPISMLVVILVMYGMYRWLSKKRTAVAQ